MLTSMLIYVLRRSRTGIKRTDTMLDVLIKYTVSTGVLTGIIDLLTTILAFVEPNNYLYDAFGLPGAHLYTITLLTALNSRQSIAARAQTSDISPFGAGLDIPAQTSPPILNVHIHNVQLRNDETAASLHIEFAQLGSSQSPSSLGGASLNSQRTRNASPAGCSSQPRSPKGDSNTNP
ncbi:hypothetical protein BD413DRAFT_565551 [Trametes elegans]|nr:hypothetical protein BD413DRAFT_565551 [Trametes elegans]